MVQELLEDGSRIALVQTNRSHSHTPGTSDGLVVADGFAQLWAQSHEWIAHKDTSNHPNPLHQMVTDHIHTDEGKIKKN